MMKKSKKILRVLIITYSISFVLCCLVFMPFWIGFGMELFSVSPIQTAHYIHLLTAFSLISITINFCIIAYANLKNDQPMIDLLMRNAGLSSRVQTVHRVCLSILVITVVGVGVLCSTL